MSVLSDARVLVMRNRQCSLLLLGGLKEKLFSMLEVETAQPLVRWLRHQVVHQPGVYGCRVLAPENDGNVGDWAVWTDTLGTHQNWGAWQHADLSIDLVHTEETGHRHPIVEEKVDQSTLDLTLRIVRRLEQSDQT